MLITKNIDYLKRDPGANSKEKKVGAGEIQIKKHRKRQ